ncbi:MAG: hypothetical protein J3K34DRAFT_216570 [Monoraphidium minutum]|nr:MAG: hypothetical protein J3K34DRAFT_216570 [Monoraphidium minutum]
MGPATAVAACSLIAASYVASLYVWRPHPGGRQHPAVISRRMLSVACACSFSWLPVAALNAQRGGGATTAELLGLRWRAAPTAAALPLAAVGLLFLGPLLHLAASGAARRAHPQLTAVAEAWRGGSASGGARAARLQLLRDLVVAPASEEWVFRACMVPLLWLAGVPRRTIVFGTPLFFGAAHLHHLRELTRVQGMALGPAAAVVLFQFLYTTVFGWLATWVFLSTGHALAPALVHAACNAMGVPPFGEMGAARPGGVPVLWAATAGGVALFWRFSGALLEPRLYGNSVYG